ncbi:glycosyltransferase family 2 protein [Streptomyces sp. ST1015]|uniref:glycosyltransferase family 2 protein n=1 Tax=unclassified Streptomyces TaxID=2593676 RepID=UPI001CA65379|nr:glycosyltransferase family 2 protein [Streptomyces sp. ST1015]QZZ25098.1 glycosyltransferase family 2 protein [Streptomyces sp. ST1015]
MGEVNPSLWGRPPAAAAVARAVARLDRPPRRRAVFTIVRDEAFFLPLWLRHYSRSFDPADIHVLDHGSTDGSTDGDGFVRVPVDHPWVDVLWLRDTVQAYQHRLMERYDAVLYADVDEIVVPDPRAGTLADCLDRLRDPVVRCTGYEVVHQPGTEPPLDPDRPVLAQRTRWFRNPLYDKPALARIPLTYGPGWHACRETSAAPDPDLYLVHLHRVDYGRCLARHRARAAKEWNPRDVRKGWYQQMRVTDDTAFAHWFQQDTGTRGEVPMRQEGIPARLGGLF